MKTEQVGIFSWIWAKTDTITKWIQVVALIVAGYWTYTRFVRVDVPSLIPVARIEFEDRGPLFAEHDHLCQVNIGVIVHNEGHTAFEVGRVQIQGWQSVAPQPTTENPAYYDVKKMRAGRPILSVDSLPDSFLNRPYPPGSSYDQNFVWEFMRIDPIWMFEVTVYDKNDAFLGSVRKWGDGSCPSNAPQKQSH